MKEETAIGIILRWTMTVIYCKPSSPLWDYERFEHAAKSQKNQPCPQPQNLAVLVFLTVGTWD